MARRSTPGRICLRASFAQITLPVRWDLCLRSCADLGVSGVVELAPGGVLAGIAKRELPGVELVAIKTPDDLAKARGCSTAARNTVRVSTPLR